MYFRHSPTADRFALLHQYLIFVTISAVHHLVYVLFINLLQVSLVFSLARIRLCILKQLFRVWWLRRKTPLMLQLIFIHFEVVYEWQRILKFGLLQRFKAFQLRMHLRLHQTWNILRPFDVFELVVVDEIEIVQLSVV